MRDRAPLTADPPPPPHQHGQDPHVHMRGAERRFVLELRAGRGGGGGGNGGGAAGGEDEVVTDPPTASLAHNTGAL